MDQQISPLMALGEIGRSELACRAKLAGSMLAAAMMVLLVAIFGGRVL